MVNRKKSPVADNEKKAALKNSKEDEFCEENPAKRQRRDSGAKQRLCFSSEPGTKKDGQDLEESLDVNSGLDNGQEVTLEIMADMDTGPDGDGSKENVANPAPVVSHQIATRSVTGRLSRRLRSYSPPKSPPPVTKKSAVKEGQKAGTSNPPPVSGTPEIKTRKQWEQWSVQDKDMFFEALYEHGKDFEAIQNSISLKLKKKDPTCGVRTKDHIRHFYYRTWHKISKFIDLEGFDDINKQALELYGLINYGELHKWIGKLNEKTGQKLNELVHKGATVVKVKQKNHRVKTPVCRALKRLHHVEEHKEEEKTKMPERVTIELFPHTNSAWAEVQSLAQNPRLRVQLRISKRIGSLVDFINRKWASDRLRMKEKLNETEVPQSEIKIHVPDTTKLSPLSVKQAPTAPKLEFSFDSYVESVKGQVNSSPQLIKKPPKSILGKMENIQIQQPTTSSQDQTEIGDHVQDNQVSSTDEVSVSTDNFSLPSTAVPSPERPKETSPESPTKCERFMPMPICIDHFDESAIPFSDLSEEKLKQDDRNMDDTDSNPCGETTVNKNDGLSEEELEAMEKLRKLERGLTVSDCGSMTIAEVYMMTGCPKKLCLEYEWVEKKVTEDIWELNKKLTNMLRRLVHLATTEFVEFKKAKPTTVTQLSRSPCRCTCGGIRNDNTPPNNKIIGGRNTRVNSPAASRLKSVGKSPSTPTSSINYEQMQTGVTKHETLMCNTDPATPPSSKCHLVMTSPESNIQSEDGASITVADGVFKLPTAMPPRVQQIRPVPPGSLAEKSQLLHQISMVQKQSEFYATKRSGQRRLQRVVRRPLVVQRTLLPKAQAPARQIMTLAMVPGVSPAGQTASFLPIMSSSVLKPGDTVLQTASPALPSAITSASGIQAVAVSQDFGVMQTATTTRSTVTTVCSASVNKPVTVRRIIPTPVTSGSEDSAVFVEAPELGGINNNILKKAALAADIQDPLSPSQDVKKDISNDLPNAHEQMNFTSGSGNQNIETPSTFSQAFTLNGVNPILSDNSLSSGHVITISESQPSTSLIPEQPNVSELLDITLPSVSDMAECTDKLLDISLMNSNSSFGGLVGDKDASLSSLLIPADDSGALSPSKVFKGITSASSDEQWLNTGDISMSNFLQDTPMRKNSSNTMTQVATSALNVETKLTSDASNSQPIASHSQPFALGESSRDSVILKNVETTFEVMMNENSMDYMSKFADLAAHINGSHQELSAIRKQAELIRDQTS